MKQISKLLEESKWKVDLLLGKDAIEEAVKSVENPRVLHIATHGNFRETPSIRLTGSFQFDERQKLMSSYIKSYLLFAGAEKTLNNPMKYNPLTDDGLLTAYEAKNLRLDMTELVVLSACESGLGEVRNWEGIYGLNRAFKLAGAKSIIMGLWEVKDKASMLLMTNFYKKWLTGIDKHDAFRQAQLELIPKYKHFRFWGPFVMVGI